MTGRFVAHASMLVAVVATGAASAAGQDRIPRTPWGAPDLQGVWDYRTITPLERPRDLADREFLTEEEAATRNEEAAAREARLAAREARRTEIDPSGNVDRGVDGAPGSYNTFWFDRGTSVIATNRTSLVVDPPDGRLPPLTEEAERRRAAIAELRQGIPNHEPTPGGWVEDLGPDGLQARCITGFNAGPPMTPGAYNNNMQLFQTPDTVVILNEMVHTVRVVPLDGRPHTPLRQLAGDSRGRWDGDTLVVTTTNFLPRDELPRRWLHGGAPADRAVCPRVRRRPALSCHRRRSVDVHPALDLRGPDAAEPGADLRVTPATRGTTGCTTSWLVRPGETRSPTTRSGSHHPVPTRTSCSGCRRLALPFLVAVVGLALGPAAHAQDAPDAQGPGSVRAASLGATIGLGSDQRALIDGPAPPVPPAIVARDEQGRSTVRAVPLAEGLRLDGRLDEPVYREVPPLTGFVQQMPDEGAPASEATEAWVMFDDDALYVGARLFDSAPPSEWVANEMRRDTAPLRDNDSFWVALDTFYDRRNAVTFHTNPIGGIGDFAITNEGNPNSDWNPIWDVRTGRFEGGWTVEMEIPFKSLRYRPGPTQLWGIQLRRNVQRRNELIYFSPVPIAAGRGAIFRVSDYATLVGVQIPAGGNTVELKPYGIAGLSTDLTATPPVRNDGDGDVGVDAKYGITQNLTADLTYNTDFAQVEVDEQQVNLTRFSLFFPEKRDFFLEGRGIFDFARRHQHQSAEQRAAPTR